MRLLKFFVVLGAVVLLAGFVLLVVKLFMKSPGSEPVRSQLVEETAITLGSGGRVRSMAPLGAGLALLVDLPDGKEVLLLLNRQGRLQRRVRLLATRVPP